MGRRIHASKRGSALILVLMVFTVLFVMVTAGLVMVDFSVLNATKQANTTQAQLTARSAADALATYLTVHPDATASVLGKSSASGTIAGMGDYTVTVSPLSADGETFTISAVSHYPPTGTADPKYTATARAVVTMSKVVTRGGNPFSSTLYVGETLQLPNGKTFSGSITILNDINKDTVQGNATLTGTLIIDGNFDVETSINVEGNVFVSGDVIFKTGGGIAPPDNIWVKGNINTLPPNSLLPLNAFIKQSVLNKAGIDSATRPVLWLIGGLLQGGTSSPNTHVLINSAATSNAAWPIADALLTEELSKIGPLDTRTAGAPGRMAEQTLFYPEVFAVDGTFTVPADTGTGTVTSARLFLQNGTQNIVVDTGGKDVYIQANFVNAPTYSGTITNTGSGRVFLYITPSVNGLTITGTVGSLIEDTVTPKTRLFLLSTSNKVFRLDGGTFNAFAYLPLGSFYAYRGYVNGSIAANYVEINDKVVISSSPYYQVTDPAWLDNTPFEVSATTPGTTMWDVTRWSDGSGS